MGQEFEYDVFLSQSSKGKAVVRPQAERLRTDVLRAWTDKWELPVATSRESAVFSPGKQGTATSIAPEKDFPRAVERIGLPQP